MDNIKNCWNILPQWNVGTISVISLCNVWQRVGLAVYCSEPVVWENYISYDIRVIKKYGDIEEKESGWVSHFSRTVEWKLLFYRVSGSTYIWILLKEFLHLNTATLKEIFRIQTRAIHLRLWKKIPTRFWYFGTRIQIQVPTFYEIITHMFSCLHIHIRVNKLNLNFYINLFFKQCPSTIEASCYTNIFVLKQL